MESIIMEPVDNTLISILHTRCPHCRNANMFKYRTLKISKLLDMHRNCPVCGQDLVPEPGFYFSAMYFSYAINVALMVTFGVGYELLMRPDNIFITMASVFVPPLLLAPWNFRISRALALYLLGGIKKKERDEPV